MIKVSAVRSALRRQVLVKAADEYSDMLQGYATRYRADSLVGPGTRMAVRDLRRKEGVKPSAPPARTPAPAGATRALPNNGGPRGGQGVKPLALPARTPAPAGGGVRGMLPQGLQGGVRNMFGLTRR